MKKIIYCISGLGTDEKIFSKLQCDGYELHHIPWLKPHKKETIQHYARRMGKDIHHTNPVLLGVSFGGMVGIEIARQMHIKKLILVSSIKSGSELPRWMKMAGKLKLHKLLPLRKFNFTERIDNRRLGVSNDEEKKMAADYRKSADSEYVNWAVHQILNWNNAWLPENITHIHGDQDKIFPVKKIFDPVVVSGGTHFMIYNRAAEISRHIKHEIEK